MNPSSEISRFKDKDPEAQDVSSSHEVLGLLDAEQGRTQAPGPGPAFAVLHGTGVTFSSPPIWAEHLLLIDESQALRAQSGSADGAAV